MPELKLAPLLEATQPDRLRRALDPFWGAQASAIELEDTRLQPPFCYWAMYRNGHRRVTLKSFFEAQDYQDYVAQLVEYYPERVGHPDHPLGGISLLPELNAVLWGFPFDPSMPALHKCVDGSWTSGILRRRSLEPPVSEVLTYRPEISAVIAYREPRDRRIIAYGKCASESKVGAIFVVMNRLWKLSAQGDWGLRFSRPIAYRPEADLLLQTPVPGKRIGSDRNRTVFLTLVERAASALAAIHEAEVPFGSDRHIEDLFAQLKDSLEYVSLVAPALYGTLRQLLEQLEARAKTSKEDISVPSHGDFKWDQFLHYRGNFSLIDFEFFCQAERAFDLGYFVAYLPPSMPRDWREGAAAEMLRSAFLQRYVDASAVEVPMQRIGLYEATMLAVRAVSHVWMHQPGWQLRASQLLDLAFERLMSPEPKPFSLSL